MATYTGKEQVVDSSATECVEPNMVNAQWILRVPKVLSCIRRRWLGMGEYLHQLILRGKAAARKLTHARILLVCEESDEERGASDTEVARAVHVSRPTVERVRKAFVEEGLERASDGEREAKLITIACSKPPKGALPLERSLTG